MSEEQVDESPSGLSRLLRVCGLLLLLTGGCCAGGVAYTAHQERKAQAADIAALEAALLKRLRKPPSFKDADDQVDLIARGTFGRLNVRLSQSGWKVFAALAGDDVAEVRLGARTPQQRIDHRPPSGEVWRATLVTQDGGTRDVDLVFEYYDLTLARWQVLVHAKPVE